MIRSGGSWAEDSFDDHIKHAALTYMGGWIHLCKMLETDVPFRAKEFENRYRAYARLQEVPNAPNVLIGRTTAHNNAHGFGEKPVALADESADIGTLDFGPKGSKPQDGYQPATGSQKPVAPPPKNP